MTKKYFNLLFIPPIMAVLSVSMAACGGGSADSGTASASLEETSSRDDDGLTVEKLTLSQSPDRTVYEEEGFDHTGTVIEATMSDGSIEEDVGFKVKGGSRLSTTTSYVIVSYGGRAPYYGFLHGFSPHGCVYFSAEGVI